MHKYYLNSGMMQYERALIDDIMFFSKYKGKKKNISNEEWNDKESPFIYGSKPRESENVINDRNNMKIMRNG